MSMASSNFSGGSLLPSNNVVSKLASVLQTASTAAAAAQAGSYASNFALLQQFYIPRAPLDPT